VFFIGEFVAASIWIMKWKVVVAVHAGEVTASGDFDGAADGDSLRYDSLVKAQAPVLIALGFHVPTGYHTTRLRAKPQKRKTDHENTKGGKHEEVPFGFPSCLPPFVLSWLSFGL
jgi:hypothetical protein